MNARHKKRLLLMIALLFWAVSVMVVWRLATINNPALHPAATENVPASGAEQRKVLYWFDPMMPQQHFEQPGKSPFMDMQLVAKYADNPADQPTSPTEAIPSNQERKVLYWYDPMQPLQHFDQPGKSPFMDMALQPKYADSGDQGREQNAAVSITDSAARSIGMRLTPVTKMPLGRQIEATGVIVLNDRDVAIVQTRSSGFVERVWPLAAGDVVRAGQPIAQILVPAWAAAQQELLAVRELGDSALLSAARQRLLLAGMPENLLHLLEHSGVVQNSYTLTAPIDGVIQSLEVRNGMSLSGGQTLTRINGLATVWLEVAVPEAQADVLRIDNQATVRLSAFPERTLQGRITAILPVLNETSRTIRVRVELQNPALQLRPGLSAQVRLGSFTLETALAIPTEAVIRTGKRTLVMLAAAQGRFTPQEIRIGHEIGDMTVVIAGLAEGQQIVSSGQFLIDSEASLNSIMDKPASSGTPMQDGAP